MKRIALWIGLFCPLLLTAQLLDSQQNPSDIHWQSIRTPHYKVIFPRAIQADAQRVAHMMEQIHESLRLTLPGHATRRWPIVLDNRSVVSNGYVRLAPRKSEWFSKPSQSGMLGTGEWYRLLAVHEGRHMAQFDGLNHGFTKFAGWLFGQYGQAAMMFLTTPFWFLEGDAVAVETAWTQSGRGRIPGFDLDMRAASLAGWKYRYYQAFLGSYRHNIPDWYRLGYFMVSHVRREYGAEVWPRVLKRSARFSFWPFTFSRSLKKTVGRNTRQLYRDTVADLDTLWQQQQAAVPVMVVKKIAIEPPEVWTQYHYPQPLSDGSILVRKSGLADVNQLVRLWPDGREEPLRDFRPNGRFSTAANKVIWTQTRPDSRWGLQSFSDIARYDMDSGEFRYLTEKGKYFSAALSPDGSRIATVEFDASRQCRLVLLDAQSGDVLRRYRNPDNDFLQDPAWSPDGERIVLTRQKYSGKSLTVIGVDSAEKVDLFGPTDEDIRWPQFYRNYILYNSPLTGNDAIWAIDMTSLKRFLLVSRPLGAYYPLPIPDQDILYLSDYESMGLRVARTELEPDAWIPASTVESRPLDYFAPIVTQEAPPDWETFEENAFDDYAVTDYHPDRQDWQLHSWWIKPELPILSAGFTVNNLTNTIAWEASSDYRVNEKTRAYHLDLSYAGLDPIFDLSIRTGERAAQYFDVTEADKVWDRWHENSISLTSRVVRNRIWDTYSGFHSFEIGAGYTQLQGKTHDSIGDLRNGTMLPLSLRFRWMRYRQGAYRDLYPKDGQVVDLYGDMAIPGYENEGRHLALRGIQYFPGLGRHHNLGAEIAGEWHASAGYNYRFASALPFVKGYEYFDFERMLRVGLFYAFPIAYPDWALGPFLYAKRLRAEVFYNHAALRVDSQNLPLRAVGLDLNLDYHLLSIPQISFGSGIRIAYRHAEKDIHIQLLFFGFTL